MRVILAKTAGFCYGVERAVSLAHETAKAHGGAMLGSVIHNANVVAELEREGMRLIASPGEAAAGETVLIRSHGESREVLEEVLKKAAVTGAAAPAIPMVDTIKRAERGVVVETMDRSSLWAVQTPQVFEASLIRAALEKAVADGETLTDDCAAVERIGMKVSLTRGDRENIKLTTPFDLMVGEAIIRQREGY